ncbi:hypothetical protein LguiA_030437 [Lonicera macranthoides]
MEEFLSVNLCIVSRESIYKVSLYEVVVSVYKLSIKEMVSKYLNFEKDLTLLFSNEQL